MKRVILILIALVPVALAAQEQDPSTAANRTGTVSSLQADAISIGDSVPENGLGRVAETASEGQANPQRQPGAKPSQPSSSRDKETLVIPGSMVGYVDSAIVGSQIRIRFDDAFHDRAPDRAEFFYPQCACTNVLTAAGPNFPGASNNINFQQVYLQAEYAPIGRFSVFAEVPFRWIEPQPGSFIAGTFDSPGETPSTQTNSGISDVRAGIKLSLATNSKHSLTLQFKAYFPSGSGSLGLGTGHYSVEPSLLYYQGFSRRWAVESQIGDWHPIGGSTGIEFGTQTTANFAGDVLIYGIGPSYRLIDGEHFKLSPVVELFGWHVFSGLQTLSPLPSGNSICLPAGGVNGCSYEAGGTNIVNIKAGMRTSFGNRNSVYVGFGQAVTHTSWYQHIVRIEYRYSF